MIPDVGRIDSTTVTVGKVRAKPPPELQDKVTLVKSIYYIRVGMQPQAVEGSSTRRLHGKGGSLLTFSDVATMEWQLLSPVRTTTVGLLIIANMEGFFTQTIPTPEERQEAEAKVLQIGVGGRPLLLVSPREVQDIMPVDISELQIRSVHGEAKYTLTVLPR